MPRHTQAACMPSWMGRAVKARLFLAVVLAAGVAGAPTPSAAAEIVCPAAAVVVGPANIAEPVKAILASHGLRPPGDGACRGRAVRARIDRRGGHSSFDLSFDLMIIDDAGRTSARRISDAATAASLIESWAYDDVASLAPLPAPAFDNESPPPSAAMVRTLADQQVGARLHAQVGPETSLATDRSWWFGASVGACARVGAICAGARLRSIRDADVIGASRADTVLRTDADALATASWLLRAGPAILTPEIGVGAGWFRTRTEGGLLQDAIVTDQRHLRIQTSMLAHWPISPRVAAAAEVAAGWSPGARTRDEVHLGVVLPGEPAGRLRVGLYCAVTP